MPDLITFDDFNFNSDFALNPVTVVTPDAADLTAVATPAVATPDATTPDVTVVDSAGDSPNVATLDGAATASPDPAHTDPGGLDPASFATDTPAPSI